MIQSVDRFVLFDDVQYTRRDWRNRNIIKTDKGPKWLTIPVVVKGKFLQRVNETRIAENSWARDHLMTIKYAYSKAPFMPALKTWLEETYSLASELEMLSDVNFLFIRRICELLSIKTELSWSSDFVLADEKTERLAQICKQCEATQYVSGPAAKDYLDESVFQNLGITVEWFDYSEYPEYEQLYPPFEHRVSILDVLLHTGPQASSFVKKRTKKVIASV